jgi:hypothetical protein
VRNSFIDSVYVSKASREYALIKNEIFDRKFSQFNLPPEKGVVEILRKVNSSAGISKYIMFAIRWVGWVSI